MSSIKKKVTNNLCRVHAQLIKNVELPKDATCGYCLVAEGDESKSCRELVYPMTREAYARAAKGTGTINMNLRNGLAGASRFRFILLLDDINGKDTIVGIHCLPRNEYMAADFAGELNIPYLDPYAAVVNIHPTTGELDVVAFPEELKRHLNGFVAELEKFKSFDDVTVFSVGPVEYSIMQLSSREVIFRCYHKG